MARETGRKIMVLAGRPYHMDPEINHGINELITSFGFVVITEDAVFQHMEHNSPRRVLNQWTYHARMYNAARYVCTQPDMELVQLVSFGCGIDAITTDEVRAILEEARKAVYPAENRRDHQPGRGENPHPQPDGRPGCRGTPGTEKGRPMIPMARISEYDETGRLLFTKEMKQGVHHPDAPDAARPLWHASAKLLERSGYQVEHAQQRTAGIVEDSGLKYVHNDTCYPALLVIGQLIDAHEERRAMTPTKWPCSSPRPAAAAGPPTTSTCCARPWKRRGWTISPSSPSTCPAWRRTPASQLTLRLDPQG